MGLALPRLDPYLTISRFLALLLLLSMLWQLFQDRKNKSSFLTLLSCVSLLVLTCGLASINRNILSAELGNIKIFVVLAALLLVHGYFTQIKILIKNKAVGALSKGMYRCFLLKEISTFAFALTLGNQNGWPLYFMHGSLFICEVLILYYIRKFEVRQK